MLKKWGFACTEPFPFSYSSQRRNGVKKWRKQSAPSSLTGPARKVGFGGKVTAKVIERFLLEMVLSVFQVISCSTYWGSPSRAVQLLGKRFAAGVESVGLPVPEGYGFPGCRAVHLPYPVRVCTC